MSKISRRYFLKVGATSIGSVTLSRFLSACNQVLTPIQTPTALPDTPTKPLSTSTQTVIPSPKMATALSAGATTAVPSPTEIPPTATMTPEPIPDLVIVKGGEPEPMVRQALAALGGIEKFVSKGAKVIIKPNICTAYQYQYAATTNPWVVATLVKMSFEAGAASVRVMDYPFGSSAELSYAASGIREQVEAAGGEMAYMTPIFKYVMTKIPNGKELKEIAVFEDILKADVLINVPIAKDHSSTRLTLGMKNLMGVVLDRNTMHINLGQRIADLTSLIMPKLTVLDAVRVLVANGPTGGGDINNVRQLDTILASPDIVAVDSYATTLFGLIPDNIAYIKAGAAMGLGRNDLENLKIQEITINA